MGVCSNELEGVAFALSKIFTQESVPQRDPCTAMTNLSSHGLAPLQAQRFGIEISFVA